MGVPLPGKWILIPFTVLGVAGTVLSYGPRLGRDASVALLAIMLGLVLELGPARRNGRDLPRLLPSSPIPLPQTIATALYMLAIMAWLTATLVTFEDRNRTLSPLRARTAGALMAQGAPLMLALFLLFRVQGPLSASPKPRRRGQRAVRQHVTRQSEQPEPIRRGGIRVQFQSFRQGPKSVLAWPVLWTSTAKLDHG